MHLRKLIIEWIWISSPSVTNKVCLLYVCHAMNSVNPDLMFTAELEEDFPTRKLPTLNTEIWMTENENCMV